MYSPWTLLTYFFVLSAAVEASTNWVQRRGGLAPIVAARDTEKVILDQYIVVFNENTDVDTHINSFSTDLVNVTILHSYKHSLKGFAGKFDKATLRSIRANRAVAFVEQDQKVWANGIQSPAPYNLAIVSEKKKLLPSEQTTFYYNDVGSGITAYIIDTGIYVQHPEFGGRAVMAANFVSGEANSDENGHGTAMAGIVAAKTYGVCKYCSVAGVKVLNKDGSGSTSTVISGINFVQQNAPKGRSVINLSIGGGYSAALNNAVQNVINSGVTTAVTSGNEAADACNYSPSSVKDAITTGAMDGNYKVLSSVNYGSCMDIFAPGYNIVSTNKGGGTITLSGSSTASAHVTGVAGYLIAQFGLSSPAAVWKKMYDLADKGFLTGVGTSPNVLLNNGYWK